MSRTEYKNNKFKVDSQPFSERFYSRSINLLILDFRKFHENFRALYNSVVRQVFIFTKNLANNNFEIVLKVRPKRVLQIRRQNNVRYLLGTYIRSYFTEKNQVNF